MLPLGSRAKIALKCRSSAQGGEQRLSQAGGICRVKAAERGRSEPQHVRVCGFVLEELCHPHGLGSPCDPHAARQGLALPPRGKKRELEIVWRCFH